MASSGSTIVFGAGDPNGTLEERLTGAAYAVSSAHGMLDMAIKRVGVTVSYTGEDCQGNLCRAIETYARAVARHEMLTILAGEDFFVAMARSAGAGKASFGG